ncbi:MAG: hypothetical protein ACHQQS_00860 [Thermoanaerobaculales bacterium]
MSDEPVDDFERAIAPYLTADMPTKHGLSIDEYVRKCRELWDACQTDETYKHKLLMDRIYMETLALPKFRKGAGYVDPRTRATTEVERPESSDLLQCIAIGAIPYSAVLRGDSKAKEEVVADPYDPTKAPQFGLWIIAVLDVLGFERMYGHLGPTGMKATYDRLVAAARTCADERVELAMHSFGDMSVPVLFSGDIGFAYFSDTLLLWAPLNQERVSPFLARCADVFLEALSLGIPLRGAIAIGEAVLNQRDGVFLGTPLIDAARLEHAQDWLGVALTGQCNSVLSWLDSSLVIPYTVPCKLGTRLDLPSGLALDWPRRARSQGMDALAALAAMQRSENHRKYYDHARDFVDHSARTSDWNHESHIPIAIGFLTRSIIRGRLDASEPLPEVGAMLDSMGLNGPEEEAAAVCFRALLNGGEMPSGLETLPEGPREHMRFMRGVLAGDLIAVEEVAMAALEQRGGIAPLTARHAGYLEAHPTEHNAEWQRCVPIVRAIAEGREVPEVPEDLPPQAREALSSARDAALGRMAAVDMEALISGVLWARTTGNPLSELNVRRLDALARGGLAWSGVATFLRRIALGEDPEADLERFDEGAVSTIRVVRKALGWQDAVRSSVQDALKAVPLVRMEFLHNLTVGAIEGLRGGDAGDLEAQILQLERAGSPHDAVARSLRRLLKERRAPQIPDGVAADVRWYLGLVTAFGLQDSAIFERLDGRLGIVKEPLVDYAFSVALEARTARRGLRPYEREILILLGMISEEMSALINYLGSFATGDEEPEIPLIETGTLRAAIDELRERAHAASTNSTLADDAAEALSSRRGALKEEFIDFLQRRSIGDTADSRIAAFLLAIAAGGALPPIDQDVEDEARNTLLEVGIRVLCNDLALTDLVSASVEARLSGDPLQESVRGAIATLAGSPEPFRGIGEYLARFSEDSHWPSIPNGVPRRALILLASARQHVSDEAHSVIAVARRPEKSDPSKTE